MAQLGNTYTGKLKDIPKYLTKNHMYYAYDKRELYGFNDDGSPYLLAPREDQVRTDDEIKNIIKNYVVEGDQIHIVYDPTIDAIRFINLNGVQENINIVVKIKAEDLISPDEAGITEYLNNLTPALVIEPQHNIYIEVESSESKLFDYTFDFNLG